MAADPDELLAIVKSRLNSRSDSSPMLLSDSLMFKVMSAVPEFPN